MKTLRTKFIISAVGAIALTMSALAVRFLDFPGWDELITRSSDIIIVRGNSTRVSKEPAPGEVGRELTGGLVNSDVELIETLKGATNSGASVICSRYVLRQGEHYMVLASLHDGFYEAIEPYRVVPLGLYFPKDTLMGKTLRQQVESVLRRRLSSLNRQLEELQEEKKRLEQGLGASGTTDRK